MTFFYPTIIVTKILALEIAPTQQLLTITKYYANFIKIKILKGKFFM